MLVELAWCVSHGMQFEWICRIVAEIQAEYPAGFCGNNRWSRADCPKLARPGLGRTSRDGAVAPCHQWSMIAREYYKRINQPRMMERVYAAASLSRIHHSSKNQRNPFCTVELSPTSVPLSHRVTRLTSHKTFGPSNPVSSFTFPYHALCFPLTSDFALFLQFRGDSSDCGRCLRMKFVERSSLN